MKKLLVLKSTLLPYSETFIKEQVTAYTRWNPVLVGERYVPGLSLDGLQTRLLPTNARLAKLLSYLDIAYFGHSATLRAERAELVHVHFGTEAVNFWPVIRQLNVPVVVTLHGFDINVHREWWEKHGGAIGRQYPGRLLKMAHNENVHFVAVSDAIRRTAIEFGLPPDRIQVKYIGVDTVKFTPGGLPIAQRSRRILYVGRLVEKKGARYLIEAFKRVHEAIPDAELLVIGDGPLIDDLKVRALGLPVNFAGKMSSDQVRQQIHEARVLCLPSIVADNGDAEGLAIVLLEAQACGVPVVTSAFGGAVEGMVQGATGFATPPKDAAAMADALIEILRSDSVAESMSSAARRFITEKFDLRRCTLQLERYYDEIHAFHASES